MHEASEYMTQAFLVRADTEIPQHQHKVLFNTQFFKISFCTNPFSYIPIDCYIWSSFFTNLPWFLAFHWFHSAPQASLHKEAILFLLIPLLSFI